MWRRKDQKFIKISEQDFGHQKLTVWKQGWVIDLEGWRTLDVKALNW